MTATTADDDRGGPGLSTTTTHVPPPGDVPDTPPAHLRHRTRIQPTRIARELWGARQIVRSLAEREIRARYKQAVLGFGWAVLNPIATVIVFTFVFGRVAKVDTNGVPYPVFSYVALIPWQFFSTAASRGSASLQSNLALLTKVYLPREIFPLSMMAVAAVDALISVVVLAALMVFYGVSLSATAVWLPLLVLLQLVYTFGIAMLFAITNVYLRDLKHGLGLILQFLLFATPVAYSLDDILDALPSWAHPLYAFVNPLGPIIDAYRGTALANTAPQGDLMWWAVAGTFAMLLAAYAIFKRLEARIVDVV